jgi:hypothetical protein
VRIDIQARRASVSAFADRKSSSLKIWKK